jgi:cytochrome c oxidase subunit III
MSSTATGHAEVPGAPPHIHHMDSTTAYFAAKLGMWLFLATEILLFGVLFTAFAIYRFEFLDEFQRASLELDWKLGGVNTIVLLFSSLTAALAVDAAQRNNNKKASKLLLITMLCGVVFLVIKYIEYSSKIEMGLFPVIGCVEGKEWCWGSPDFNQTFKMYFGLYYTMTMLHALHVVIGMGLLFWVWTKTRKNRFSAAYYTPVEMGALYWHLVDLIWIFLFPLLYLVE